LSVYRKTGLQLQ